MDNSVTNQLEEIINKMDNKIKQINSIDYYKIDKGGAIMDDTSSPRISTPRKIERRKIRHDIDSSDTEHSKSHHKGPPPPPPLRPSLTHERGHRHSHKHPSHGHPSHGHPSHGHPSHRHPSHGHPSHGHPSHRHPSHGHPSHGHPSHRHPSHGHPSHGHPSHKHPSHKHPSHGHHELDGYIKLDKKDAHRRYKKGDCYCPESDAEVDIRRKNESRNRHKENKRRKIEDMRRKIEDEQRKLENDIREEEAAKKKEEESENIINKGLPHDEDSEENADLLDSDEKDCTPGMVFVGGTAIVGICSVLASSLSMILKS